MSETQELKPCPFCGKPPHVNHRDGYTIIECGNDECRVIVQAICDDSAESNWNTRADSAEDGWKPISEAPLHDHTKESPRVMLYSPEFGIQFGKVTRFLNGDIYARAEGFNGEWNISHFRPIPTTPNRDAAKGAGK